MTIDRRLHHAARELREIPIDVPPLGTRPAARRQPTRILQALAAPTLFVAGGLFAYGAVQSSAVSPPQSDIVGIPAVTDAPSETVATQVGVPAVAAPSVRAELQMIAEIVSSNRPTSPAVEPTAADTQPAPTTSPTNTSMTESVGPI